MFNLQPRGSSHLLGTVNHEIVLRIRLIGFQEPIWYVDLGCSCLVTLKEF